MTHFCRDGLGDISNTHKHIETPSADSVHTYFRPSNKSAATLALDLIRKHPPNSITYIALGPLTNLALMMRKDPATCRERLGRVVCMGGALDVPGNTTPVAECESSIKESDIVNPFTPLVSQFLRRPFRSP